MEDLLWKMICAANVAHTSVHVICLGWMVQRAVACTRQTITLTRNPGDQLRENEVWRRASDRARIVALVGRYIRRYGTLFLGYYKCFSVPPMLLESTGYDHGSNCHGRMDSGFTQNHQITRQKQISAECRHSAIISLARERLFSTLLNTLNCIKS
jgi:hypothetical protein